MVSRSRAREGRSSAAIPEIETRPEPEIINPAEIQVSSDVVLETRVNWSRRLEDNNESLGLGLGS